MSQSISSGCGSPPSLRWSISIKPPTKVHLFPDNWMMTHCSGETLTQRNSLTQLRLKARCQYSMFRWCHRLNVGHLVVTSAHLVGFIYENNESLHHVVFSFSLFVCHPVCAHCWGEWTLVDLHLPLKQFTYLMGLWLLWPGVKDIFQNSTKMELWLKRHCRCF